jgi:hypothetical protein
MEKIVIIILRFIATYSVSPVVWNDLSLQEITPIRIQNSIVPDKFARYFRPKRVINIWFLGKNNLSWSGYLLVASETDKYPQTHPVFELINRSRSR